MRTAVVATAVVALVLVAGAATASADPRVTLSYFASRGRAEPIRLLLEFLDVPFKDHRFQTRDDWLGVKESGHFAFNQVPGLRWCEDRSDDAECFDLVQSHTIMRFLARKHGAYLDESQRHWVDLVADGAEDFKSRLSKLVYSEDGPEKLQDYLETTAREWLGFFERLKGKIDGGQHKFFAGDTITHADLYLFYVIELHVRQAGYALLEDYPLLREWWADVGTHERVAKWRQSRRRPEFANGASASLDCPHNPPAFTDFGDPWPTPEGSEL